MAYSSSHLKTLSGSSIRCPWYLRLWCILHHTRIVSAPMAQGLGESSHYSQRATPHSHSGIPLGTYMEAQVNTFKTDNMVVHKTRTSWDDLLMHMLRRSSYATFYAFVFEAAHIPGTQNTISRRFHCFYHRHNMTLSLSIS